MFTLRFQSHLICSSIQLYNPYKNNLVPFSAIVLVRAKIAYSRITQGYGIRLDLAIVFHLSIFWCGLERTNSEIPEQQAMRVSSSLGCANERLP